MRLLQRMRKKKSLKRHAIEITFPTHSAVVVYDKSTMIQAIWRVYDLWRLDDTKAFTLTQYLRTISWIEASVKHGG